MRRLLYALVELKGVDAWKLFPNRWSHSYISVSGYLCVLGIKKPSIYWALLNLHTALGV
jgi:hypothetical protein